MTASFLISLSQNAPSACFNALFVVSDAAVADGNDPQRTGKSPGTGLSLGRLELFYFRPSREDPMAKKPAPAKTSQRLATQTDLSGNAVPEIADALNGLVADSYALYTKTKNFHWHVSGPHFRDYHLLFDEQATEIFATIDELAERVRKIGARTIHSIGEISRLQSIQDNDSDFVPPGEMLSVL